MTKPDNTYHNADQGEFCQVLSNCQKGGRWIFAARGKEIKYRRNMEYRATGAACRWVRLRRESAIWHPSLWHGLRCFALLLNSLAAAHLPSSAAGATFPPACSSISSISGGLAEILTIEDKLIPLCFLLSLFFNLSAMLGFWKGISARGGSFHVFDTRGGSIRGRVRRRD